MPNELSILLPVYNCTCTVLVRELQRQCSAADCKYEIIVADDGSSIEEYIALNRQIEHFENVRYIIRKENVGRSRIRNFLVTQAKYNRLLFIDGDLSLDNPNFIRNYLSSDGDVTVGGITIGGTKAEWGSNLRWKYEKHCEKAHTVEKRKEAGNKELHTNFCIKKELMHTHLFNEQIKHYGYEDVLLGKSLADDGIKFIHIYNPVLFLYYESNADFLTKTEESLYTLFKFKELLTDYSHLLSLVNKYNKFRILTLFNILYSIFGKRLKDNLKSNNPNIHAFRYYKLMYFAHIVKTSQS